MIIRSLIVCVVIFASLLIRPSQIRADSCQAQGKSAGDNFHDCGVVNFTNWSVGIVDSNMPGIGAEGCAPNYRPNSICGGNYSEVDPICDDLNCCVPCEEVTSDVILERGESCGGGIEGQCATELTCRSNRCVFLVPQVGFGYECIDNQECRRGTSYNPDEALICRDSICNTVEGGYCDSNEKCQSEVGPESFCDLASHLCLLPPAKEAEPDPGVPYDYCAQVPGKIEIKKEEGKETEIKAEKGSQYEACQKCMGRFNPETGEYPNEGQKIYTAVGCISVDGKGFATDLIKLLLGVGGMATLLSILAASFIYTTSRGDSGKIKEAKDLITSAVSGLLFIIFSVIILEYIGVQVLHIPGLGSGGESGAIVPTSPPLATLAYSVEEGGACRRDIDCKRMSSLTCEDGVCTDTMDRLAMGSVPLGGECYFNEHCISSTPVNDPDNPEIEYPGSVQCENNQCKLKFVGVTPCAEKADKDGYCQELLDNSRAHCIENTDWNSLCSIPWADPEIIQCNVTNSPSKAYTTEPNYCNEAMNSSSDKYECFTPPGGTAGYCRDAKLSKSK